MASFMGCEEEANSLDSMVHQLLQDEGNKNTTSPNILFLLALVVPFLFGRFVKIIKEHIIWAFCIRSIIMTS